MVFEKMIEKFIVGSPLFIISFAAVLLRVGMEPFKVLMTCSLLSVLIIIFSLAYIGNKRLKRLEMKIMESRL